MKLRDLNDVYKNWNDNKLIHIIQHPEDYQPEAVIAATNELERRKINIEEIEFNHEPQNDNLSNLSDDTRSKVLAINQKFNSEERETNPFYQIFTLKGKAKDKQILYISLYFVYQGCFTFLETFNIFFDNSLIIYSTILAIIYLFCSYLLWKRKKWGWIIANLFLCAHLILFSMTAYLQIFGNKESSVSTIILLKYSNLLSIINIILTCIGSWVLSQKSIREIFSIRTSHVVLLWGFFTFFIFFYFKYFLFY